MECVGSANNRRLMGKEFREVRSWLLTACHRRNIVVLTCHSRPEPSSPVTRWSSPSAQRAYNRSEYAEAFAALGQLHRELQERVERHSMGHSQSASWRD